MKKKHTVVYVTSNEHKREENRVLHGSAKLSDGTSVRDLFDFDIRPDQIKEILEVDLSVMVQAEAIQAYSLLKIPCVVEHGGLVFVDYEKDSYPGGLTKPMWNALGDSFVDETHSAGRQAIARAVVGYCDGMGVRTFVGETRGVIADSPRGSRAFYWDTVFQPNDRPFDAGRTYAEIVEDSAFGLEHKVLNLSQSTKAMMKLLEQLRATGVSPLWS